MVGARSMGRLGRTLLVFASRHRHLVAALSVFAGLTCAAGSEPADPGVIREWSQKVESCFERELARQRHDDVRLPDQVTGFARMFVYEQIINALPAENLPGKWDALIGSPPEQFCTTKVIPAYLGAYRGAYEDMRRKASGSLAGLGTGSIESNSIFVEYTQNHFGVHAKGHYDITMATLQGAGTGSPSAAMKLMASATQTPDLYRWSNETYHAHTSEFIDGDAADRARQLALSRERFVDLLRSILAKFKASVGVKDDAEALFELGVAAHLVQDLVYHRGMTLRQHAGLSYYLRTNPDFPEGAVEKQRWDEAVALTHRLFDDARASVGDDAWKRLMAWTPYGEFDFHAVALKIYVKDQDIGVGPLMDYYLMILPYVAHTRSVDELQDTHCAQDRGLACWNPEEVLSKALARQP